jgi:hypothetical protein
MAKFSAKSTTFRQWNVALIAYFSCYEYEQKDSPPGGPKSYYNTLWSEWQ